MKNKKFSPGNMPGHDDKEVCPSHVNDSGQNHDNDESRPGHVNAKRNEKVDHTRPGAINLSGDNFGRKGGSNSAK